MSKNSFLYIYIDTLEANQLFSYAKELSESEQLDEPDIEVNVNVPCKHKTYFLLSCMCIYKGLYDDDRLILNLSFPFISQWIPLVMY